MIFFAVGPDRWRSQDERYTIRETIHRQILVDVKDHITGYVVEHEHGNVRLNTAARLCQEFESRLQTEVR